MSIKTLAEVTDLDFRRIQFTPDLLPADLIGTRIFDQRTGDFSVKKGPVFAHFILADEINRAPAKVQSALLESMQERQVTIGTDTFPLPSPFFVMATENPIELEGTYPLPEAQVDRFMLKINISYPSPEEEVEIVNRNTKTESPNIQRVIDGEKIKQMQDLISKVYVDEKIIRYIIDIVNASRTPEAYDMKDLKYLISYGGSPRASIFLTKAAKAHAFINGRGYVIPEDVKEIGMDVLRHRVLTSYEAEAEGVASEDIIAKIFDGVKVP
jgi:MoxR-like ATPase